MYRFKIFFAILVMVTGLTATSRAESDVEEVTPYQACSGQRYILLANSFEGLSVHRDGDTLIFQELDSGAQLQRIQLRYRANALFSHDHYFRHGWLTPTHTGFLVADYKNGRGRYIWVQATSHTGASVHIEDIDTPHTNDIKSDYGVSRQGRFFSIRTVDGLNVLDISERTQTLFRLSPGDAAPVSWALDRTGKPVLEILDDFGDRMLAQFDREIAYLPSAAHMYTAHHDPVSGEEGLFAIVIEPSETVRETISMRILDLDAPISPEIYSASRRKLNFIGFEYDAVEREFLWFRHENRETRKQYVGSITYPDLARAVNDLLEEGWSNVHYISGNHDYSRVALYVRRTLDSGNLEVGNFVLEREGEKGEYVRIEMCRDTRNSLQSVLFRK